MERFPFLFRDKTITISAIQLFALAKADDFNSSALNISLKPQKGKTRLQLNLLLPGKGS